MRIDDMARTARVGTPGTPTPVVVRAVRRFVAPLVRAMWRPRIEGLAHLPTEGPYLIVANHSAGCGIAELLSFAALWVDVDRPLAGFAHPWAFHVPPVSWFVREAGCVPSTHAHGGRALDDGVPLLVFPGGDHEVGRPVWRAREVDFGGRAGFARLAAQHRVPIVPMGIVGSHVTAPVLGRATGVLRELLVLPRLLGVKRWPITLLAVVGALALLVALPAPWPVRALCAWAWLASPLALLPYVPSTITFRIGAPIDVDVHAALPPAEAAARIEAAVRALVQRR